MFYRENDEAVGVLCDWDLAYDTSGPPPYDNRDSIIEPEKSNEQDNDKNTEGSKSKTGKDKNAVKTDSSKPVEENERPRPRQYRTGTGPFMACEMLNKGEIPLHIYRYDLESFFWLLAWFCAVFDPEKHAYVRTASWEHTDLYTIGEKKRSFIDDSEVFNLSIGSADVGYRDLSITWVYHLRSYFRAVLDHECRIKRIMSNIQGAQRLGDPEGEVRNRGELDKAWAEQENVVTYTGFMQVLGEVEEE